MSTWQDRIGTDFVIITGDGNSYTPEYLHMSVSKNKDYNFAKYEFVEVSKSLVLRELPMSTAYEIEIIFEGADHLDVAAAFYKSADNRNAWQIRHPFYGNLVVQPVSVSQNDGDLAFSKLNCNCYETIGVKSFLPKFSAPDQIAQMATGANTNLANSYAINIPSPKLSDIQALTQNINTFFDRIKGVIQNTFDYTTYYDLYSQCTTLVNNTTFDSLQLIRTTQELIMAPVYFTESTEDRVNQLVGQLAEIGLALLPKLTPAEKRLFENNGGTLVNAICLAAITNLGASDYPTRTSVASAITTILGAYNGYIANLNSLQTLTGGSNDSYIPDPASLISVNLVLNYTLGNLFAIASNAAQQREYILPADSNVIQVAHKLYGTIPADDSTITYLIKTNNIIGNEIYQLKQGRKIVYYV
jgi:hypothetical protein